jgi:hypothetical protein
VKPAARQGRAGANGRGGCGGVVAEGIAKIFQKHSSTVIGNDFILRPTTMKGEQFDELLALEDAGLITGVQGNISKLFDGNANDYSLLKFAKMALVVKYSGSYDFQLPAILLTNVGRQILSIVDPIDDEREARRVVGLVPKQNVSEIVYGQLVADGLIAPVTLWDSNASD